MELQNVVFWPSKNSTPPANVQLLFPPGWTPFSPYLALPCLKAFLESENISVQIHDWNLDFFDEILNERWLQTALHRCRASLEQYDIISDLPERQSKHYRQTVRAILLSNSVANIGTAKDIFRSKKFYHAEPYKIAKQIIAECLDIASASYFGLNLKFNQIEIDSLYDDGDDLGKVLQDRSRNPFVVFYENKLKEFDFPSERNVLGISVTSESQLIPALTLCRLARSKFSNIVHITLGGNFITRLASDWKLPNEITGLCDSIILFEGELALASLAASIGCGQDFCNVPNLLYEKNGLLIRNAPVTADITQLPTPNFDGFPLTRYLMPDLILPLYTSRSCYAKCSFCTIPYSSGGTYRTLSPGAVFRNMQSLSEKYGVEMFDLIDETVPLLTMKKLSGQIMASGAGYQWFCETRFSAGYTLETCTELFRGGCRKLQFGLESYSQRILDLMQKNIRIEWVGPTLDSCMKSGIAVHLFFMVGFPGESRQEALNTLEFTRETLARAQLEYSNPHWTRGWGLFSLEKFSDVYNRPDKYGIKVDPSPIGSHNIGSIPFSTSFGMSRSEAAGLVSASHRDVQKHLSSLGWFAFHTHNFNLNSEEESFLRICAKDIPPGIDEIENLQPPINASIQVRHRFLAPTHSGIRSAFYEPSTRSVWEGITTDEAANLEPPPPFWLLLRGSDEDYYAYDTTSGRRVMLDFLTFNFLTSFGNQQNIKLAVLELRARSLDVPSDRQLQKILSLSRKHGMIGPNGVFIAKEIEHGNGKICTA